jgi:uncharacterized protein YndB with AHSA1/START domain
MALAQITAEPAVPQIVVTREFAAPRDLLFRAFTDPELLVQWLGSPDLSLTIDHFDARHGGTWRYTSSSPTGDEYSFRGVFHGTPSPDCIVQTFEFEDMPGHVCLETVTFTERGDVTVLTQGIIFQSAADRDAALESNVADGINESMERLDELLARLAPVR